MSLSFNLFENNFDDVGIFYGKIDARLIAVVVRKRQIAGIARSKRVLRHGKLVENTVVIVLHQM